MQMLTEILVKSIIYAEHASINKFNGVIFFVIKIARQEAEDREKGQIEHGI